jgi:hypothetical protein
MFTIEEYSLIGFGALVAILGIWVFIFKKQEGKNVVKIFGQEFEISAPALVIVIIGCGMAIFPFWSHQKASAEVKISEDDRTRITSDVTKRLCDYIDSGYSKTFVFSPDSPPDDNFIIFYARAEQEVEINIIANSTNANSNFRILIDNKEWGDLRNFPYNLMQGKITSLLRYDTAPGGNLHVIKFIPEGLSQEEYAIIDAVVIVKNSELKI